MILLIFTSYASLFLFAFVEAGRGLSYPSILTEFALSPSAGSFFFTLPSMAALLSNFTSQFWVPLISPGRGFKLCLVFQLLGHLSFFLAGKYHLLGLLYGGGLLYGIGYGGVHICATILLSNKAPPTKRKAIFSGFHATYALGWILAPQIFSLTVDLFEKSWFFYFLLASCLNVALLFFPSSSVPKNPKKAITFKKIPLSLKVKFGLFLGLQVAGEVCLSSRMNYYLQDYLHWPPHQAHNLISLFFLFFFFGRIAGIFIPSHFSPQKELLVLSVMNVILVFGGLLVSPWIFVLLALPLSLSFPFSLNWVSQSHHDIKNDLITSMFSVTAVCVMMMHFFVGQVADVVGIGQAMLLPGALFLVTPLFLFWKTETS